MFPITPGKMGYYVRVEHAVAVVGKDVDDRAHGPTEPLMDASLRSTGMIVPGRARFHVTPISAAI
jgi:hypothetical protein